MKRKVISMNDIETVFSFIAIQYYGLPETGDVIKVLREMMQKRAFLIDDGKEPDEESEVSE